MTPDNQADEGAPTATPRNVVGSLCYNVRQENIRPWMYRRRRTNQDKHDADSGGKTTDVKVEIRDGRHYHTQAMQRLTGKNPDLNDPDLLTLDSCGFELCKFPEVNRCSLTNSEFYEPSGRKVKEEFYPLVADFLKRCTGAPYVKVVRHSIRNGQMIDRNLHVKDSQKQFDGLVGYSSVIHTDYTQETAEMSFRKMADFPETRHYRTGRFLAVCVWKPLGDDPVQNDHLTLVDDRTISRPEDTIEADIYGQNFQGVIHRLDSKRSAQHRWYYFPNMQTDEVCVFKHYDSDPTQKSTGAFHTSFVDPTAPEGTLNRRQNIDVRAFCYFPDHTPNTCPIMPPVPTEEECLSMLAHNFLLRVARNFHNRRFQWPGEKKDWVVDQILHYGIAGTVAVAKDIVADEMNVFELKGRSTEEKEKIVDMLLENEKFGKALRESVEQFVSQEGFSLPYKKPKLSTMPTDDFNGVFLPASKNS